MAIQVSSSSISFCQKETVGARSNKRIHIENKSMFSQHVHLRLGLFKEDDLYNLNSHIDQ